MMKKTKTESEYLLYPELWEEIMTRLPAKTLLRFRSISRSFLSQIDSREFISKHLNLFRNNQEKRHFVSIEKETDRPCNGFRIQHMDTLETTQVNFSVLSEIEIANIEVYVDGLLVTGKTQVLESIRRYELTIHNLSIRKSKTIINLPHVYPMRSLIHVGLGFNALTNDHNIVTIEQHYNKNSLFRAYPIYVNIFSLRKNSRENFQMETCYRIRNGRCFFMDGSLHWLGKDSTLVKWMDTYSHIISFNLGSKIFSYTKLPDDELRYHGKGFKIKSYVISDQGSLGLMDWFQNELRIWVMHKGSWTKLPTVNLQSYLFVKITCDGRVLSLKDSTEDDKLAFVHTHVESLVWYS